MNNVIRVIGEYIPDVRCIDLSENKLPSLDHFSLFEENTSNLEILNLSNNRLNDIRELEKLQDLQHLKCLRLDNNPLGKKHVIRNMTDQILSSFNGSMYWIKYCTSCALSRNFFPSRKQIPR